MKDYKLLLELSTSFVIFSSYFPSKKMEFMKMYRRIRKHSSFIIIILLMGKSMTSAFAAKDNVSVSVEVIIEALVP